MSRISTPVYLIVFLLLFTCLYAMCQETTEGRAIWVTRFDYKTAEDVAKIIKNCKNYHFNQILFQVRGNGTVFYKSEIEPWAFELTSDSPATTGKDPGWNPLKLACELAHKGGLQLHAYMNVFPGWRSQKYPPKEVKQLWWTYPNWFMVDKNNQKMIPRDHEVDPKVGTWYSFINPAIPEVKDYLDRVFLEVINNYDIDGIHLDYIRYPSEIDDFSYDPVSLQRFKEEYGRAHDELPHQWIYWRGKQVTEVVRRIYQKGTSLKPGLIVSASVTRNYSSAKGKYFQRSQEWLEEGILDIAMPMIYTRDQTEVEKCARDFLTNSHGRFVYPGLGAFIMKTSDTLLAQIALARKLKASGLTMFAYSSFFSNHQPNEMAQALLKGPFAQVAKPPALLWKTSTEKTALIK